MGLKNNYKDRQIHGYLWRLSRLILRLDNFANLAPKHKEEFAKTDDYLNSCELNIHAKSSNNPLDKIHACFWGEASWGYFIVFRGTEGASDWLNNTRFHHSSYYFAPGEVFSGFAIGMTKLLDFSWLYQVVKMLREGKNKRFFISGHSKGGALASFMACVFSDMFPDIKFEVVTFGMPNVGNKEFKEEYDKLDHSHISYLSILDIVPHVPFTEEEAKIIPKIANLPNFIENNINLSFENDYCRIGTERWLINQKPWLEAGAKDNIFIDEVILDDLKSISELEVWNYIKQVIVKKPIRLTKLLYDSHMRDYNII